MICGDDPRIKHGKPSPDIFLLGLDMIGQDVSTQNVLVFEDSPAGVEAGLNANMQVVWIPDENLAIDPKLAPRCAQVLKSMAELKPEDYGLPPYE